LKVEGKGWGWGQYWKMRALQLTSRAWTSLLIVPLTEGLTLHRETCQNLWKIGTSCYKIRNIKCSLRLKGEGLIVMFHVKDDWVGHYFWVTLVDHLVAMQALPIAFAWVWRVRIINNVINSSSFDKLKFE
jgi:hypothetical protein